MIRIGIVADTHADETKRWDEHCRVMDWIAEDMDQREVHLACHAGDVYEAGSTPLERTFVADWSRRVAYKRPLVICRGNHDPQRDIAFLNRLRSRYDIRADETPDMHRIWMPGGQHPVMIATLPWPRKSWLLESLGPVSPEESSAVASDHLRNILRGFADEFEPGVPRLLLAHAMVDGAKTNHDQPLIGMDMAVSAQDLALSRASFVAVGHVHCEQEWTVDGIPIVYPGAPRHTEFGPPAPTGYLIVDFEDDGTLIRWERVPTPARPMLLVQCSYHVGEITGWMFEDPPMGPENVTNAEIRFRYGVAPEHRDAARRAARELADRWKADGAHSVKPEEQVRTSTRARAPEIAAARTLPEKLQAFWAAKGIMPEASVKARLLGKLAELEVAS